MYGNRHDTWQVGHKNTVQNRSLDITRVTDNGKQNTSNSYIGNTAPCDRIWDRESPFLVVGTQENPRKLALHFW
jgi:hypothetical protein